MITNKFRLLLPIFIFNILLSFSQSSKYFPENCWGVYSWAGWKTNEVTPTTHPLIKGAPLIFKWSQLEPRSAEFKFEEEIKSKL